MDAGVQKHRMMRWMRKLSVALSLVASCGVLAAVEIVPPIGTQYFSSQDGLFHSTGYDACTAYGPIPNHIFYDVRLAFLVYPTDTPEKGGGSYLCEYENTLSGVISPIGNYTTVAVCPSTTAPSQPYIFYTQSKMCERVISDKYTITLSGGTEVEPSNGSNKITLAITATVKDQSTGQKPATPVKVRISLKVDSKSGGHDHDDNTRPRGGIAEVETCPSDAECWPSPQSTGEGMTDGNGQVVFNFNAPEASGTHTITATCDGCGNPATKSVNVKVDGLELIPSATFYTFIGETDKHSGNHYLTPEAASILWRVAVAYQVEQQFKLQDPVTGKFTVNPPVLHINDASLEWGGLFDVYGKWASPHVEHRRGTVVDIRANSLPTAIPAGNLKKFKRLATYYEADAFLETPSADLRHFHLRLLNRKE